MTDINMLLFVEWGIRGGIAPYTNPYGKANKKKILMSYSTLPVFDLFSTSSMVLPLPYGNFERVDLYSNRFENRGNLLRFNIQTVLLDDKTISI